MPDESIEATTSGDIPVTVVMRSYNDAALLPQTLGCLKSQRGVSVRLIVFESASVDGSPEIIKEYGCDKMVELEPGTYHSATVLNQGTDWAESELVAYVNSDAIMMDELVLRRLAEAILASDKIAGAFARQIPRPDASRMTRLDYFTAFENREELGRFHDHMSLVCSMVRKSVWQQLPFDSALTFAEDFVWSEGVHRLGYQTKYVPAAVVEHSHNYKSSELFTRHFGDAAALSKMDFSPPAESYLKGFCVPLLKRYIKDAIRLFRMGRTRDFPRVIPYRYQGVLGHWRGSIAGYHHFSEGHSGPQPKAKPVAHLESKNAEV